MTIPPNLRDKLTRYLPQPTVCGVYFLVQDNEVVYVGKSTNVIQRLAMHEHTGQFDECFYFKVSPEKLDETEQYYINALNSPLNRRIGRPVTIIPEHVYKVITSLINAKTGALPSARMLAKAAGIGVTSASQLLKQFRRDVK